MRGRFDDVEETGASEIADSALMVDIVHQEIEERKVFLLRLASKLFSFILELVILRPGACMDLEPSRQDLGLEPDLGGDIKSQLNNLDLGVQAQTNTVGAGNADQQVGQARREGIVLYEGLFLAVDEAGEEQHGFLDNPLIVRGSCDLGDGDVDLLGGSERDARVRQGSARFLGKDVGQLLKTDLEDLGSVDILGEIRTITPDVLERTDERRR